MPRRKFHIRKMKISARLTVSSLCMCLIPVAVLLVLFYNRYQTTVYDKLSVSKKQNLELLAAAVDYHLIKCENISDSIMMDATVQSTLSKNTGGVQELDPEVNAAVSKAFNNLSLWESYMKGFSLCSRSGTQLCSMGFINLKPDDLARLLDASAGSREFKQWTFMQDMKDAPYIVLCRKIFSTEILGQHIGYVLIYVDAEQLFDTVGQDSAEDAGAAAGTIIMEPGSGKVILIDNHYSSLDSSDVFSYFDPNLLNGEKYAETKVFGADSVVVVQRHSKTGWVMVGVLPKEELVTEMNQLILQFIIVVAIILLIGAGLLVQIRRSINQPIANIVAFTKRVAQGDFTKLLNDPSKDEIGYLSADIDVMVAQISELFAKNEASERKKRQLELDVLEYQINPHFLFNTLNSFKYIAELNGITTISTGITSLCNLLKNTITNSEEFIPLRREINNVSDYLLIQRIKFAGMFEISYDISEEAWDATVVRLMLQPIVENSILHGIDEHILQIRIRACVEDGLLVITITDDGKGFDTSDREITKRKFTGIGLSNVQERVRLNFGEQYGLDVESSPGSGTKVTVRLPYTPSQRE